MKEDIKARMILENPAPKILLPRLASQVYVKQTRPDEEELQADSLLKDKIKRLLE